MRVREGGTLGFRRAVVPAANARQLALGDKATVIGVRALDEFFAAAFGDYRDR
jgi:hypothetical protein